jgi:imidazolonepropionase
MPTQIITNIEQLVNVRDQTHVLRGVELSELPVIENAYLIIEDGIIAEYGEMKDAPKVSPWGRFRGGRTIHSSGVVRQPHPPCFCRQQGKEFVDKIKGLSYAEIAAKGGGILNSAKKLHETSEDELFNQAWKRLGEVSKLGTGAIEIKSGYGSSVEGELKMLRVIKKLKERSSLSIRSLFWVHILTLGI